MATPDPHLTDFQLSQVIERATKLQAESGRARGVTRAQAEQIGKELGVEPRFVQQAMKGIATDAAAAAAADAAAVAKLRRWTLRIGAGLVVLLFFLWVLAFWGARGLRAAQMRTERAEVGFRVALDRQNALIPQLVALAGGGAHRLAPLPTDGPVSELVHQAALAREAMTTLLADLPPTQDPGVLQQRLSLQFEVTGSQNRIAVEQRRYGEALAAWRAANLGGIPRLALLFGMAEAAPED